MLSKMKRKLMICAMALCICAGLTGNTGEVSVWASEGDVYKRQGNTLYADSYLEI